MTQTVQSGPWDKAIETDNYVNIAISEANDNLSLLYSVFDSLNNLNQKLYRLNRVIQRKNIGLTLDCKGKGETK
jgi:hypothetical protein